MPRRTLAVGLMRNELRWLPGLARRLPVAVPAPVRVGEPAPELGYDAPWSIVPWFPGRNAVDVDPATRGAAAPALATFVAAMGVPAPAEAPANPFRGVPLASRDEVVRGRLTNGRIPDAARLVDVWERALAASVWSEEPMWLHGDLHPANLVLEASGGLAAIVDFGDLTAGDPATDLATAWLTFDAPARAAFRAELERRRGRPVDRAGWDRARGWALVLGTAIVEQAGTRTPFSRMGAHALEQVLLD
jgi:aminoglycoside phosphotransferase (APT) family kinase protein